MYGYEGAINTHTHSFPSVNDSPDICGQNFDVMVNSSSLDMYNHAPPCHRHPTDSHRASFQESDAKQRPIFLFKIYIWIVVYVNILLLDYGVPF